MPSLRSLLAAAALFTPALWATQAFATVSVGTMVTLAPSTGRDNRPYNELNRQDCIADANLTFPILVTDTGSILEIWVGTGCETKEGREKTEPECWKVLSEEAKISTPQPYVVSVRSIVKRGAVENGVAVEAEVCDQASTSAGAQPINVYFVSMSTDRTQLGFASWPLEYDLAAPAPPTDLRAGPGEAALVVSFEGAGTTDGDGYVAYCEPSAVDPAGAAGTSAVGSGSCSSSSLVPGERAPDGLKDCGQSEQLAPSIRAEGLVNGQGYTVALASKDKFGNVGALSELVCGTPADVTGFFEAYRQAGGQAGGGFCGFSPPARRGNALAVGWALALGAAAWLRRRP